MKRLEMEKLEDYLLHILEAIEKIFTYIEDVEEITFLKDSLIQDAVIRNLEIIGEASHKIELAYPMMLEQYPDLPLSQAYQMRNAIAHGYFKVDYEIVWKTLHNSLPNFYEQVRIVVADLESNERKD